MPISEIIANEEKRLAPYAVLSRLSKGRVHPEKEHAFRTAFQRDRDRIIHSNAFRRLEYKTQVFVYHEGDHYRTRLTHTIEVAQIARTISRALGLNEDLSEAIALAHDMGHPPFGHTGENVLNELMKDFGGFEHNAQSLRIVEELEKRYPDFRGLNLTWEVREGIIKHKSEHDRPGEIGKRAGLRTIKHKSEHDRPREIGKRAGLGTIKHNSAHDRPGAMEGYEKNASPTLEAQIVDVADEIAYNNHDIDDGLSSEMIDRALLKDVRLWQENFEEISITNPKEDFKILKYQTVLKIINQQATDLVDEVSKAIKTNRVGSPQDIRRLKPIARFSPAMEEKNTELKKFLKKNLYQHYRVLRMADKAGRILKGLFEVYLKNPRLLPPHFSSEIQRVGKERLICDYIAGMTDRFALDEYKKLFDPYERV